MIRATIGILAVATTLVASAVTATGAAPALRAMLPGDAVPIAYDLSLAPDVEHGTVAGSETIDVRLAHRLDAIRLNARHIKVRAAQIDGTAASVAMLPTIDQLRLTTRNALGPGIHRIRLVFESTFSDDGTNGYIVAPDRADIVTMFEPSSARTVFPCFDEPRYRAVFTLHARTPATWAVVSNMPAQRRLEKSDGSVQTDFQPTPPMPTYLVTLDAGAFAHVDGSAAGVPLRIFFRSGREEQARALLADAERLLPFYERFFGVRYPLPKLDIVISGRGLNLALEGWGAIGVFAEQMVFGTRTVGFSPGRRRGREVLAHEMAHQWAGDLVTVRWWRDLFVAEGVAQFSQRRAMRDVFADERAWLDDDRDVGSVMARSPAHPRAILDAGIGTDLDEDDWQAFDSSTYDKGASVLEAWFDTAGAGATQAGFSRYFHRHANGSATFEELWHDLGGADAVRYGRSWLAQPGFPLVDIRTRCESGRTHVVVEQRPFALNPQALRAMAGQRWIVPLEIRTSNAARKMLLAGPRASFTLASCGPTFVDLGKRPYYVVRYDDPTMRALATDPALAERDRERLVRDYALMESGGATAPANYLFVVTGIREPFDDGVWLELAKRYRALNLQVRGAPNAGVLYALEERQLRPFVERFEHLDSVGRPSFVGEQAALALIDAGDPAIGRVFAADLDALDRGALPKDFMPVFITGGLAASAATPEQVRAAERTLRSAANGYGADAQWSSMFLYNIGDESMAADVLADAMRDAGLRKDTVPADVLFWVGNRHPALAYDYLRTHLRELKGTLPPTQQAWRIANGVADSLWPAASPRELGSFLRAAFPGDAHIVRAASERISQHWSARLRLDQALSELRFAAAPPETPAP